MPPFSLCVTEEFCVADKTSKPNRFQRFGQGARQFIKETIGELRKVSWPTRGEAWDLTKVVLIVLFVMTIFLGTLDLAYSELFRLILGA
jgi:preprotein translocase subunit SecE